MNDISNTIIKTAAPASGASADPASTAARTAVSQTNQVLAASATSNGSVPADRSPTAADNEAQPPPAQQADQAQELAENLNALMQQVQRSLRFSVDDNTGSQVIQVVDLQTDEVVRQIPAEEVLTLRSTLADVQERLHPEEIQGMLFETTA